MKKNIVPKQIRKSFEGAKDIYQAFVKYIGCSSVNKHFISELPIKSFGSINFTYISNKGNPSRVLPVSQNENQSGDSPAIIRCLHIKYTEIT